MGAWRRGFWGVRSLRFRVLGLGFWVLDVGALGLGFRV